MFDALQVLHHAFKEERFIFRTREALAAHQASLAARHVAWAVRNSAFTRDRFERVGLSARDWAELPVTTKSEMAANFDRLNTAGLHLDDVLRHARHAEQVRDFTGALPSRRGHLHAGLSTGTSGNQTPFVVSGRERRQWAGTVLRHLLPRWPHSLLEPQRVAFFLRADGGLYRSVKQSALHFHYFDLLTPLEQLARDLSAYAPTLLVGPPSVLRLLAEAGAQARPERVVCVAEVLEPDDIPILEHHFGPVVQVYQATEGLLALPCSEGHLHLNEAHVHFQFEAVGPQHLRPIITDLRRTTQPIIRHRLDDLLQVEEGCPCGSAHLRVTRIIGRHDDVLHLPMRSSQAGHLDLTPGTGPVWPDFIRNAVGHVPTVQNYRVIQECATHLHIELDCPDEFPRMRQAILDELVRCGVDVQRVTLSGSSLSATSLSQKRRRVERRSWALTVPDHVSVASSDRSAGGGVRG